MHRKTSNSAIPPTPQDVSQHMQAPPMRPGRFDSSDGLFRHTALQLSNASLKPFTNTGLSITSATTPDVSHRPTSLFQLSIFDALQAPVDYAWGSSDGNDAETNYSTERAEITDRKKLPCTANSATRGRE